jgi:hypothetical protein
VQRQKLERRNLRQKKAAGLCSLAVRFGTWDVRPPETPKRVTEVRCFTPGENRSERISTRRRIIQKATLPALGKGGNAPTLLDPIKSPQLPEAGTHFRKTTRRLLGSRERHLIFVAENRVVIQVGAGDTRLFGGLFF